MVHITNPSTSQAEAGRLMPARGQPRLCNKTLSQEIKTGGLRTNILGS